MRIPQDRAGWIADGLRVLAAMTAHPELPVPQRITGYDVSFAAERSAAGTVLAILASEFGIPFAETPGGAHNRVVTGRLPGGTPVKVEILPDSAGDGGQS